MKPLLSLSTLVFTALALHAGPLDRKQLSADARWVLHLISAWQTVLRELDRAVAGDGAIAIEPGGESGVFRDVFLRFHEILGDVALPPGLHPIRRGEQLDEAMWEIGWRLDHVEALEYTAQVPLATFFDEIPDRRFSWTWNVPGDALAAATGEVRAWAAERFDLDAPQPAVATRWRVYRRVCLPGKGCGRNGISPTGLKQGFYFASRNRIHLRVGRR